MGRRYVLGVDGGATKTVALVGTVDGKIVGRGQSGSSNYHNVGARAASLSVRKAVADAKKQAKIKSSSVDVAVVALAAADSNRDRAIVLRFVKQMKMARKSVVVHDTVAALEAATHGRPGIIVISGTGCVAAGVNRAGRYVRVGGWGYVIDDEGSGYDIGAKAMRSAFRTIDGRAPYTKLTITLKHRFQVEHIQDALSAIYSDELGVNGVAALAPLVSRLAPVDRVCRNILKTAGENLAELSCATAKQLGMTHDAFPIALVGGTFKAGSYLLRPLVTTVRKECPRAKVRILNVEPALGALSLAVKELQN